MHMLAVSDERRKAKVTVSEVIVKESRVKILRSKSNFQGLFTLSKEWLK